MIHNDFDLARVTAHSWLADVRYFDEVASTNDVALQYGADPLCKTPLLVLAKQQTEGRGRGTNPWWSSEGSLTFSLLFNGPHIPLQLGDWPRLPLITGLAVANALRPFVTAHAIELKWPNDVYLQGRKVGGILVESTSGPAPSVIIGIGLNVNNRLANAPAEVADRACSLADAHGSPLSLTDVLCGTLLQISQTFSALPQQQVQFLEEWRRFCLLTGRRVEVQSVARNVQGICLGIDNEGALCIETSAGLERCFSGTVRLV